MLILYLHAFLLYYYFTKENIIITVCVSLIIGAGMLVYLWLGYIAYAFSENEHFVEKDSKKMVACVNSFMKVRVEYYDYINSFVRGNKIRIEEDYGRGGYDPFDSKEEIIPKRITYYNNGEVINETIAEK